MGRDYFDDWGFYYPDKGQDFSPKKIGDFFHYLNQNPHK